MTREDQGAGTTYYPYEGSFIFFIEYNNTFLSGKKGIASLQNAFSNMKNLDHHVGGLIIPKPVCTYV
jgi:hypothetical protein